MSEPRRHAVLFVHGAGGGGWEWGVWGRVFAAAGYAVHAPDLKPVDAGIGHTRLADYADQVRTCLGSLRDSGAAPVVVGASLGGLLALMNSDLVEAVVLVNPLPPAPWHARLPTRGPWPAVVPWAATASLEGTRRAMPDADDAACLYAFRSWRDESGAVLEEAYAGVRVPLPAGRVMLLASGEDSDVPAALSRALADELRADVQFLPGASHVGPLLGRQAGVVAASAVAWLNAETVPG